jgi:hypothetical protein
MNFLKNYAKPLFLTTLLLLGTIYLSACSDNNGNTIICKDGEAWIMNGTDGGYIFTPDGDLIAVAAISDGRWYGANVGTYSIGSGSKLTTVINGEKDTMTYKVSGSKLTLSGKGDPVVFTKKTGVHVNL